MRKITAFLGFIFLFFSFTLLEYSTVNYTVTDDFTISINGTSNVHDWTSSVTEVTGVADVILSEDGAFDIEKFEISMPVKSIKSTKGSIMDRKTYKALEAKTHPNIIYKLDALTDMVNDGTSFSASSTGNLTIAGVTKQVIMSISGKVLDNGNIEIQGSKDLKMTMFGIDPPTALLGTMTTGDDINIEYRVVIQKD